MRRGRGRGSEYWIGVATRRNGKLPLLLRGSLGVLILLFCSFLSLDGNYGPVRMYFVVLFSSITLVDVSCGTCFDQ